MSKETDESRLPEKYAGATPGPWHADTQEHYTCGGDMVEITLHDEDGMVSDQIASVMLDTGDDTPEDQKRYKEQEANARLIADAPQLAAENEALRKENAELNGRISAMRLEWDNQNANFQADFANAQTDRDRLQEQVRVLREAAEAAKQFLQPELVEPGRTVFWKLVDALASTEPKAEPKST